MKQATICFLVGLLHAELGSCLRDDADIDNFMVNGSNGSDDQGIVVVAEEMRYIAASGDSVEEFEKAFNQQVNLLYTELGVESGEFSLLETGGTNTKDFCPARWLPMLAKEGRFAGKGQYGKVYLVKVECSEERPELAVKVEINKNPYSAQEIAAGKLFNHAHLVKVYDSDKLFGKPVILMEAAGGGDLDKKYKSKTMKEKELSKYVLETLYGLKHVHDSGYAHADFKPEQVYLACDAHKNCHTKIGDFGFTSKAGTPGIRGTPFYFSPELLVEGKLSKTADMWAVGVSIFEMMNGGKMPSYLDGAYSIPKLKEIMTRFYYNEQFTSKHSSTTTIADRLIHGLLQVNTVNRLTVDGAIDLATEWAETFYNSNEMATFAQNDNSKRVPFPDCWMKCKDKCTGQRCQANPQAECTGQQPVIANQKPIVNHQPIVHKNDKNIANGDDTVQELTINLYLSILSYIRLDQDARLVEVNTLAYTYGFRALDVITEVNGHKISRNGPSGLNAGQQAATWLQWERSTVKVERKVRVVQKAPVVQRKKVWSKYVNYPYGGYVYVNVV